MDLNGPREDSLMLHTLEHWVGASVQRREERHHLLFLLREKFANWNWRELHCLAPAEEWGFHARQLYEPIGHLSVSTLASAPPPELLCLLCTVAPLTLEALKPTEKKKWKEVHLWKRFCGHLYVACGRRATYTSLFLSDRQSCVGISTPLWGESLREEGDAIYRALAVTVLHTCHSHWPLLIYKNTHRQTHTKTHMEVNTIKCKCWETKTFTFEILLSKCKFGFTFRFYKSYVIFYKLHFKGF